MIIGIVGKIGSGKSTCVKFIKNNYNQYNIYVFSCDEIAKKIIEDNPKKFNFLLVNLNDFFTNDLLQKKIREDFHPIVFDNIKKCINNKINKNDKQLFIIESALPNEQMYKICDKIICIKSSDEHILNRLIASRNYTESKVQMIYSSQKYYEKFYDKADYVVINNGKERDFLNSVKEVIDEICIVCK